MKSYIVTIVDTIDFAIEADSKEAAMMIAIDRVRLAEGRRDEVNNEITSASAIIADQYNPVTPLVGRELDELITTFEGKV